nr:hypothetical protein [Tanacetum cinerariifolium]
MPAPDQSPAHLPTPFRPQTSNLVAPVLEHDHSSDLHKIAAGSFLSREDAPLGGDFHTSPSMSSHAPPAAAPANSLNVPAADSLNVPVGVSSKGKSPMVEDDIPIKPRTFKQIEED